MAELRLEDLGKAFGTLWVVRDVTLTVADGEFVTLLGPSGCGKTTTLRMIAGFVPPTAGRILVAGRVISSGEAGIMLPPERRGMGMVFQSYAVWPHMDAFHNVAYPLRRAGLPPSEIEARTKKSLSLVHLEEYAGRYPHELSGGQQQRIALARALIMEPSVLLLDEPLSNLDAKLREEMRFEIKELQQRLGITVVYVTHDQSEAMVMSHRIAVMSFGRVVQVGTPDELYEAPATPFVASFLGVANFLRGEVVGREGAGIRVRLPAADGATMIVAPPTGDGDLRPGARALVCIRPEALRFDPQGLLRGRIIRRTYLGSTVDYLIQVGSDPIRIVLPAGAPVPTGEHVTLSITRATLYPETSATTSSGRSAT